MLDRLVSEADRRGASVNEAGPTVSLGHRAAEGVRALVKPVCEAAECLIEPSLLARLTLTSAACRG